MIRCLSPGRSSQSGLLCNLAHGTMKSLSLLPLVSAQMTVQFHLFRTFLGANQDAVFSCGATDEEIAMAECELGVSFPAVFRRYLSEFGYLEIRSAELYGLGAGVPQHLDLVRNTKAERSEFHPYIPHHLIPFLPNGGGDHYCIDLSSGADDPPVVFWNHELDSEQRPPLLADRFTSWLLQHTNDWCRP